jgi:hypothetical protein
MIDFQLEDDLAEAVAGLAADRRMGPIALARRGAEIALLLCDKYYYERPLHIWHEVGGLARALVEARPACMPLVNFANAFVRPLPEFYGRGKDEGARMRADLRARVEEWLRELDARAARIDQQVAELDATFVSPWAVDDTNAWVPAVGQVNLAAGGPGQLRRRDDPASGQAAHLDLAGDRRLATGTLVYLVAGPEKLVPPGYRLTDLNGLQAVPLAE